MGLLAVFGITNDGLNLAVNLLLLFLVVFWLALVYWTYADARRRVEDPMLVACAAAASLFPFAGTIVYLIVRPPEYLEDVRERELEIAAAEARLASIEQHVCPYCSYEIEKTFLRCPSCLRRLKEPCTTCGKPLDPRWKICPYCEAEVGAAQQAQPTRRERRPRRERPPASVVEATPQAPAEKAPKRSGAERASREAPAAQRADRPARAPAQGNATDGDTTRERPARPRN
jgi:double zinc ribbon protein